MPDDLPKDEAPIDFLRNITSVTDDDDKEKKAEKKEEKKDDKGKDENVKTLRQLRDAEKARADKLQKEIEDLKKEFESKKGLEVLDPIADYIKKKEGKLDPDAVNNYISKNKKRKEDLSKLPDLEQKLEEKDKKIKEFSIESSDEWVKNYQRPIEEAGQSLFATVINLDKDDKPKHEGLVKGFLSSILKLDDKGNPPNALQIRSALSRFSKHYEDQTGEEYEAPRLNDLVDGVNSYVSRIKKAGDAKQNWEKEVESNRKNREFSEIEKQQALQKRELGAREILFKKFVDSDEFKEVRELVGDEAETIAQEEHVNLQKVYKGEPPDKKRQYHEYIKFITQGLLFEKLVTKLKDVQAKLEKAEKDRDAGLGAKGGKRTTAKDDSVDKEEKAEDVGNPLDFLKA